jgi:hypothetical protein
VVDIDAGLCGDIGELESEGICWERKWKTGGEDSGTNGLLKEIAALHGRVTKPFLIA